MQPYRKKMSILSVKNLSSLEFNKDVTFIIGENGAGKSTHIEAIALGLYYSPILMAIAFKDLAKNMLLAEIICYIWKTWNDGFSWTEIKERTVTELPGPNYDSKIFI